MPTTLEQRRQQAISDFTNRWLAAIAQLGDLSQPQWKRVPAALSCFRGLVLSDLPPRLRRQSDRCFAQINAVLVRSALENLDDYQKMSAEDLGTIEQLIKNLVHPVA